jgi:hypothetical protein
MLDNEKKENKENMTKFAFFFQALGFFVYTEFLKDEYQDEIFRQILFFTALNSTETCFSKSLILIFIL